MNNKILTIGALAIVPVAGVFATTPMAIMPTETMMETVQKPTQNKNKAKELWRRWINQR